MPVNYAAAPRAEDQEQSRPEDREDETSAIREEKEQEPEPPQQKTRAKKQQEQSKRTVDDAMQSLLASVAELRARRTQELIERVI